MADIPYTRIILKKFENRILSSNCYLISVIDVNNVIVVDPGDNKLEDLIKYLEKNNLLVEYIIFSHEHYDHIAGGLLLKQKYNCKLIASEECAQYVIDPKKNLSIFYDGKPYVSPEIDITIEELNYLLHWNTLTIHFFKTPGHSKGSICFYFNNYLFTGDTLIHGNTTVTNLPGGNKQLLEESLTLIRNYINPHTTILPGHKDIFIAKDSLF
jgi:hydroxyacylglutathione hydrolase